MDCDGGWHQRYQGGAYPRRRYTCTCIVLVLYTPVRKVFGENRGMILGDALGAAMYYGGSSRHRGQSELRPKSPEFAYVSCRVMRIYTIFPPSSAF